MKTYTNKSNAVRAARKQFGQGNFVVAQIGQGWCFKQKLQPSTAPAADEAKVCKCGVELFPENTSGQCMACQMNIGPDAPKPNSKTKGPTVTGTVTGTVTTLLRKATEDKPVDKATLLQRLVALFPDRNAESMATTVSLQIARLRKAGEAVQTNGAKPAAYWIG